ncbi:MAG TPA: hypothetical protein DCQ31_11630 [Bacteroidales bacterium]|nr:hypothetical protein [Bacteroidales bacterium]
MKKILLFLAVLLFISCSKENEEFLLVKTHDFGIFWGVAMHNNFDFEIHRTDSFRLQFHAPNSIMEKIKVLPAPSSKLEIFNDVESPFNNTTRPLLKVYEAQPVVFSFTVDGSAQCVQADTIDIIDFTVIVFKHAGNLVFPIKSKVFNTEILGGNTFMDISGKATVLNILQRGEGRYNFNKLQTDTINIIQNGGGYVYLGECKQLNVTIDFSGNVYYKGNPQIILTGNGTGKLIKIQ